MKWKKKKIIKKKIDFNDFSTEPNNLQFRYYSWLYSQGASKTILNIDDNYKGNESKLSSLHGNHFGEISFEWISALTIGGPVELNVFVLSK